MTDSLSWLVETLTTYRGFPKRRSENFAGEVYWEVGIWQRMILTIQTFKPCVILNITFLKYLTLIQIKISMTYVNRKVKQKLHENPYYVEGEWLFGDGKLKFGRGAKCHRLRTLHKYLGKQDWRNYWCFLTPEGCLTVWVTVPSPGCGLSTSDNNSNLCYLQAKSWNPNSISSASKKEHFCYEIIKTELNWFEL